MVHVFEPGMVTAGHVAGVASVLRDLWPSLKVFAYSGQKSRMADTAAHLVDRVFPRVPVRQWVLSLPYALRYRLAYDASLVTDVLAIFTSVDRFSLHAN